MEAEHHFIDAVHYCKRHNAKLQHELVCQKKKLLEQAHDNLCQAQKEIENGYKSTMEACEMEVVEVHDAVVEETESENN